MIVQNPRFGGFSPKLRQVNHMGYMRGQIGWSTLLTPFKNSRETSMEMTFDDLKKKHLKAVEAKWKLRATLQDKAGQLLNEYIESLCLPAITWMDSGGKNYPYVDIGLWPGQGEFKATPLACLPMDNLCNLNFVIATTLDDSPATGGYMQGVSITLRYYDGVSFYALVGTGKDLSCFQVPSKPGGFCEVCAAIKRLIDTALERATPTVVAN